MGGFAVGTVFVRCSNSGFVVLTEQAGMNARLAVRIERHDDTATLLDGFGVADGAAVLDLFKIGFDLLNAVVGAFAFLGFLFLAVKLLGESI